MNCNEFQHWLLIRDIFSNETPEALLHIKACAGCSRLYMMDTGLEKNIQSVFIPKEVPKGLTERIDLVLDQTKEPLRLNKTGIAAVVAGIALMAILTLFMKSNNAFQYQSPDHLSEIAAINHLKGNMAMSFTAEETKEALVKMRKELKFNVIFPDLSEKGYALLGGRLCFLDECRTVYLFYKKADKTVSLFILDDDHLGFKMADGMRYSNAVKECRTDIWKENGQVYALVSSF